MRDTQLKYYNMIAGLNGFLSSLDNTKLNKLNTLIQEEWECIDMRECRGQACDNCIYAILCQLRLLITAKINPELYENDTLKVIEKL